MFETVSATEAERRSERPGDDIVAVPDVVIDRGFTVIGLPDEVWPWLVQLGKGRAGWYLPASIERFVPKSHRAIRHLDPRWTHLEVGDVVPDYGGPNATLEVALMDAPHSLVYRSARGRTQLSWAITLVPHTSYTRVLMRLRLGPVPAKRAVDLAGELVDAAAVAALAVGLRERLAAQAPPPRRNLGLRVAPQRNDGHMIEPNGQPGASA